MGDFVEDGRINRRQFLKVVGFATGSAALAPFLSAARPVEDARKARRGRMYSGTQDGHVLRSADGKTWAAITNFGPKFNVREVEVVDEWVLATLEFGGQQITLKSRDDRTWYTLDYVAPDQGS